MNDFYDYGLVMAAVGRIEEGERPYRDFGTPIQSGVMILNGLAESLFGRDYIGMTRGSAVLIVAGFAAMAAVLARRWSPLVSLLLAGALAAASLSQHTIIWYNGLGVLLLALVAWAGAYAPVLDRRQIGWNMLLGASLVLGGLNKVSFQMIALALAMGWPLRAWLLGHASGARFLVTAGFVGIAGVVVPIGLELAWSGASLQVWWHNVVALPALGRSGNLVTLLDGDFYLRHFHNYYGPLLLPSVGLLGVVLTLWVAVVGLSELLRRKAWLDATLLVGASILAAGSGAGLLATNHEIGYLSLAAWLVLLMGIWLGFALPYHGFRFWCGLVAPAMLVGVLGWQAAWVGQRALWGFSAPSRASYISAFQAGPEFGYLSDVKVSPSLAASLEELTVWRQELSQEDRSAVFYGAGAEWLERVWPMTKVPALPLWFALGTSYGEREVVLLRQALESGGAYTKIVQSADWDGWMGEASSVVENGYVRRALGPALVLYEQEEAAGVSLVPLDFITRFGGNASARLIYSDLDANVVSDGRHFLGTDKGSGAMTFSVPSYRLRGEAVLKRLDGDRERALHADFAIAALPDGGAPVDVWMQRLELPAGQMEIFVPYEAGGGGMPLRFRVTIPDEFSGRLAAGWRNPTILHAAEETDAFPRFRAAGLAETTLDEDDLARLVSGDWRPAAARARGGERALEGFRLRPGGELWLRVEGTVGALQGVGAVPAGESYGDEAPVLRAFHYKGGRIEITSQEGVREDRTLAFRLWSAEPGGWLVVSLDPSRNGASVVLKVTEVRE